MLTPHYKTPEEYLANRRDMANDEIIEAMGHTTKTEAMESIGAHRNSANNKLRDPDVADEALIAEAIRTAPLRSKREPYAVWAKRRAKPVAAIQHWANLRKAVIRRDQWICRVCGADSALHVHHVDKNRANNAFRNLVTLCQTCHQGVHVAGYYPGGHGDWDGGIAWGGEPEDCA